MNEWVIVGGICFGIWMVMLCFFIKWYSLMVKKVYIIVVKIFVLFICVIDRLFFLVGVVINKKFISDSIVFVILFIL